MSEEPNQKFVVNRRSGASDPTGVHAERPQLKRLLRKVTHFDVVIVPAVDRLSRDTTDLTRYRSRAEKGGRCHRSLVEPLIETTSDLKEVVPAIFGVAAKLERRGITSAPRAAEPTRRLRVSSLAASQTRQSPKDRGH
jgi:DNA invertase Pin-like site-specific DNA recombinase